MSGEELKDQGGDLLEVEPDVALDGIDEEQAVAAATEDVSNILDGDGLAYDDTAVSKQEEALGVAEARVDKIERYLQFLIDDKEAGRKTSRNQIFVTGGLSAASEALAEASGAGLSKRELASLQSRLRFLTIVAKDKGWFYESEA